MKTLGLILILAFLMWGYTQITKKNTSNLTSKNQFRKKISPEDLNIILKDVQQLLDVRSPEEYNAGHLKNAKNINFFDSDFLNKVSSKLDKDKPIYLYCRSGGRSGRAAIKLQKSGFTKIYDLSGGIINWRKNNLEVVKK